MIPKQLNIGGMIWVVKQSADVSSAADCFGQMQGKTQTIFLDPECTRQKAEETLLHEIIHTVMWQTSLEKRLRKFDATIDEEIANALAYGLYQVLKDNNFNPVGWSDAPLK